MSLEVVGNTIGGTSGDLGIPQTESFSSSPTNRGWVETTGSPTYGSSGAVFSGGTSFQLEMDTISAKEFFCMTFRTDNTVNHNIKLIANGVYQQGIKESSTYGASDLAWQVTAVNLHNGTWQIQYAGMSVTSGGYYAIYDVTTKNLKGAVKFGVLTENSVSGDIILINACWL